ncbi:hypothetical protein [Kitasatospora sp. NPDC002040]
MIVVTSEPFGFFLVAALAGVIFCALALAVIVIWGTGGDDE